MHIIGLNVREDSYIVHIDDESEAGKAGRVWEGRYRSSVLAMLGYWIAIQNHMGRNQA